MQAIETVVQNIQNDLTQLTSRLDGILTQIQDAVEKGKDTDRKLENEVVSLRAEIVNESTRHARDVKDKVDQLEAKTRDEHTEMTSRTDILAQARDDAKNTMAAMEQQLLAHMQNAQEMDRKYGTVMARIQQLPPGLAQQNVQGQMNMKPVMEYKIVQSLETLTNNKM